jgi:hypothetical protein
MNQTFGLQLFNDFPHIVGRSIINYDDLIGVDRFDTSSDGISFIVSGHDRAGREPKRRQLLSFKNGNHDETNDVPRHVEHQREPK